MPLTTGFGGAGRGLGIALGASLAALATNLARLSFACVACELMRILDMMTLHHDTHQTLYRCKWSGVVVAVSRRWELGDSETSEERVF